MKQLRPVVVLFVTTVLVVAFARDARGQCQLQQLVPLDRLTGDQFGDSVAVSGDWAIVGASRDDSPLSNSGSATIFHFDGLSWTEFTKIEPLPGQVGENDLFGWSVDIDAFATGGPLVAVGAYLDDDPSNSGSVYLYRFDGVSWSQETQLVASDSIGGEEFGRAVAVSGDVLAVGAPRDDDGGTDLGAVYVYRRQGATWPEVSKLIPSVRADFDRFGVAVDVDASTPGDERVIAGASLHDPGGISNAGGAWVFHWDGNEWTEYVLTAPDPAENDKFGEAVTIAGDTAVVGAFLSDGAANNGGSAVVFEFDGTSWTNVIPTVLQASDASSDDQFGHAAALSEDGLYLVVGAALDDDQANAAGAAYLFRLIDGTFWNEEAKVFANDAAGNDEFGISVGVAAATGGGNFVIVGANKADDPTDGTTAGKAYIFTDASDECSDCNNNQIPDAAEIIDDPLLDCNNNGLLDVCEIVETSTAPGGPFYCVVDCNPDCNENGIPDDCDIASGVWADDDGNGVPDVCEDCNNNGIPDSIDIDKGSAIDCNGNGVPDSCELADGTAEDCNGNGILDSCDIDETDPDGDGEVSNDCNDDLIPDECDDCNENGIADDCDVNPLDPDGNGQVSLDENNNGVPDECEDCNQNGLPDYFELNLFPSLDCNDNGTIDACEIHHLSTAAGGPFFCTEDCNDDCNNNGIPDDCDIAGGFSMDEDESGVPDECEDCNGNTIPDSLDISSGDSQDCDGNGIPDECQIHFSSTAPGGPFHCVTGCSPDCNDNGIPDWCDALNGLDCNENGVPDECEEDCDGNGIVDECDIADGTWFDLNDNGVPDICDPDCDGDGTPDFAEILFGLVEDCNDNGVPDPCDIDPTDPDGDGEVVDDINGDGIPDPCLSPADVNNDGVVDFSDLLLALTNWGTCADPEDCPGDVTGDGIVGFDDVLIMLTNWG